MGEQETECVYVREGGSEGGKVISSAHGGRWRKEREKQFGMRLPSSVLLSVSLTFSSLLLFHHVVCSRAGQTFLRPIQTSIMCEFKF